MTDAPDDTSARHEIRWTVASLPPAPELVERVRAVFAQMSPQAAEYERERIKTMLPAWDAALGAEQ